MDSAPRRVSSPRENGSRVVTRTRPASDCEIARISRKLREPDSTNRPGAGSASTSVWM